jgi:hypothetical protein
MAPDKRTAKRPNPEPTNSDPGPEDIQDPTMDPQPAEQGRDPARLRTQSGRQEHTDEEIKVRSPDIFYGKPASQLRQFLTQLRLVFLSRPSQFQSGQSKVIYAVSYLRGTAFSWIQPYIEMDDPPAWFSDFALFTAEINKLFGDPEFRTSAASSLDRLKQTGSVVDYAAEFRRLATVLNWENEPLTHRFYHGLKDEVKDELARSGRPRELEAIIMSAITIDKRFHERVKERTYDNKPSPPAPNRRQLPHTMARVQHAPPVRSVTTPRDPAPTTSAPSGPRPVGASPARPRFQKLTEEEKAHRRSNNLCMYCGHPNHIARECPVRPKIPFRPARASEATFVDARPMGNAQTQL